MCILDNNPLLDILLQIFACLWFVFSFSWTAHFSLCFSLGRFYCYVLKFTNLFFYSDQLATNTIRWTSKNFIYFVFHLQNFCLGSYLYLLLISSLYIFPSKYSDIFMIAVLTSLSANSFINVISRSIFIDSYWCIMFFSLACLEIFQWVLDIMNVTLLSIWIFLYFFTEYWASCCNQLFANPFEASF